MEPVFSVKLDRHAISEAYAIKTSVFIGFVNIPIVMTHPIRVPAHLEPVQAGKLIVGIGLVPNVLYRQMLGKGRLEVIPHPKNLVALVECSGILYLFSREKNLAV
jgi:hypothetical protein